MKQRFHTRFEIPKEACILFGSNPKKECSVCHFPSRAWAYSKKFNKHFCSHCFPIAVEKDRKSGGNKFPHIKLKK